MAYDLLVKNGTVVDGSGSSGYRADVGIIDGKIAAIGRINEGAKQTIEADGHIVSPGLSMVTLIWTRRFFGTQSVPALAITALLAWLWGIVDSP